jgi:hypothetical protein
VTPWLLTQGPARKALGLILTAAAILLFLLNLMPERKTMRSTARCSTPPPAALLIAMLWLTGCATGGSDARAPCPPIVDYTAAEQVRAADEVEALPESAAIVRMLGDYAALRDQVRACQR